MRKIRIVRQEVSWRDFQGSLFTIPAQFQAITSVPQQRSWWRAGVGPKPFIQVLQISGSWNLHFLCVVFFFFF